MPQATGADVEHRRQKISNLLLSMKYGIKAMKDWKQEESRDDEEIRHQLRMFEKVHEELNKPYHQKTAGLPSPKSTDTKSKKQLFGDDEETIEQEIETLKQFADRLLSEESVDDEEIDEMIEQATEVGEIMQNRKPI